MAKLMLVEDESIVAKDLMMTLQELGYDVSAIVSSGEEAVQRAEDDKPDLVLMDIVLQGEMDGVAAAEQIHSRLDIPVVYLTAYADDEKIGRAKITEPFGYIIKPFSDSVLRSNIEVALYKHRQEKRLKENLDVLERLNKLLLKREFRIKELRDENELLKKRIEELEKKCKA